MLTRLRTARLGLGAGVACILGGAMLCALRNASVFTPTNSRSSVQVEAAAQDAPDAAPLVFNADADATRDAPATPEALRAFLGKAVPPALPENSVRDSTAPAPEPDWLTWGRLRVPRAAVTLAGQDGAVLPPELAAYACRSAEGATFGVFNRSTHRALARIHVRLPRGLYRIERLTLPLAASTSDPVAIARLAADDHTPDSAVPLPARLENLGGHDFARVSTFSTACALEPGQGCLLRCTDEAEEVKRAAAETNVRLHALEAESPGPARRMRRILDEGGSARDLRAQTGRRSDAPQRLACIHRMLLYTAQAHSLHRNYQARSVVKEASGAALMGALERLNDALSEASAALLGLTPQISVESEPSPAAPAEQEANTAESNTLTVLLSLANRGTQPVALVKIGLDASALPPGVTCAPSDSALFGTVPPGQTVRAEFHLRCPADVRVAARQCVGDISYFAAHAPAHLRPRPW